MKRKKNIRNWDKAKQRASIGQIEKDCISDKEERTIDEALCPSSNWSLKKNICLQTQVALQYSEPADKRLKATGIPGL